MSKYCGSQFLLQRETTAGSGTWITVGGLRSNGISIANEFVDVTDKTSMPWREGLGCGMRTVSISGAGVWTDDAVNVSINDDVMNGNIYNYRIISGAGDSYDGPFLITGFDRNGEHNADEQWSATFESTGAITYTATP